MPLLSQRKSCHFKLVGFDFYYSQDEGCHEVDETKVMPHNVIGYHESIINCDFLFDLTMQFVMYDVMITF